jgi:hypothetical protein
VELVEAVVATLAAAAAAAAPRPLLHAHGKVTVPEILAVVMTTAPTTWLATMASVALTAEALLLVRGLVTASALPVAAMMIALIPWSVSEASVPTKQAPGKDWNVMESGEPIQSAALNFFYIYRIIIREMEWRRRRLEYI